MAEEFILRTGQDMSGVGENHNQLLTSLPASFVMNGGEISENVAQTYGGGLVNVPPVRKQ